MSKRDEAAELLGLLLVFLAVLAACALGMAW